MELVPFTEKDFEVLLGWIDSEQLSYQWGGPLYAHPLTTEQIASHCGKPEVNSYLFQVDGQKAGFIELRHLEAKKYRLCRVFLAEPFRGRGLSKILVTSAIEKAQSRFGCNELSLAVFEPNTSARQCYLGLGFVEVDKIQGSRSFNGEVWHTIEMQKRLL